MANPMRGDVEVEALGRRYIFRLGINELLELQTALGYEDEETFLNEVGQLKSIRALRIIGACALARKPDAGAGEVIMGLEEKEAGDVLSDLGVMYRRNRQPEKAIEAFDRALAVNPNHQTSRYNKGVVMMHDLEDRQGALAAWEELVTLNPQAKAPNGKLVSEMLQQIKSAGGE